MDVMSVRDYRKNLAASFDRADQGERVLIRRKNSLYALVSVGSEDVSLSEGKQREIEEMATSLRRSWSQVKHMEEGTVQSKSALAFIDEL